MKLSNFFPNRQWVFLKNKGLQNGRYIHIWSTNVVVRTEHVDRFVDVFHSPVICCIKIFCFFQREMVSLSSRNLIC